MRGAPRVRTCRPGCERSEVAPHAATDNRPAGLAFRRRFGQTRAVTASEQEPRGHAEPHGNADPDGHAEPHGHADAAGEQMHSELDAIQERLRVLKRKLDARESVVSLESDIAQGD